jgi:hypothetical protein
MSKKFKKLGWLKLLEEVPGVRNFFESRFRTGKGHFRGIGCCCLPFAILLIVPVVAIVLILGYSIISYFQNGFDLQIVLQQVDSLLTTLNDIAGKIINLINLFGNGEQ